MSTNVYFIFYLLFLLNLINKRKPTSLDIKTTEKLGMEIGLPQDQYGIGIKNDYDAAI
ncbi:hypothetical protein J2Y73_000025 [Peribacillus frigoritolerans]|uniref:hypothetical protein n=1 Tax=Peribacillus frigoritolerans TaxID=450367 RepID=UPI00130420E2|nr:hypothetical protein [Peribacillus frigoritolerans]MCP1489994.1 hypothetical protein [Peribacillus frigoritolerans]